MIAADTSAWIDFFRGIENEAERMLEKALSEGSLVIPSPVLFELLSGPGFTSDVQTLVTQLPRLTTEDSTWERAGFLRRKLVENRTKARGMDCLIAQNCIDHDVPLISRDADFRHFVAFGLTLIPTVSKHRGR